MLNRPEEAKPKDESEEMDSKWESRPVIIPDYNKEDGEPPKENTTQNNKSILPPPSKDDDNEEVGEEKLEKIVSQKGKPYLSPHSKDDNFPAIRRKELRCQMADVCKLTFHKTNGYLNHQCLKGTDSLSSRPSCTLRSAPYSSSPPSVKAPHSMGSTPHQGDQDPGQVH